jgi:hypothetical protein
MNKRIKKLLLIVTICFFYLDHVGGYSASCRFFEHLSIKLCQQYKESLNFVLKSKLFQLIFNFQLDNNLVS